MNETQSTRLAEMTAWLTNQADYRQILCGSGDAPDQRVLDLVGVLAGRGYYEFLLVLLMKYGGLPPLYDAIRRYAADRVGQILQKNGPDQEAEALQRCLAEET